MSQVEFRLPKETPIFSLTSLHPTKEVQAGDVLKITFKEKNDLWPDCINVVIDRVMYTDDCDERVYYFFYDDALLQGGVPFEDCDILSVTPFSQVDKNQEDLQKLITALVQAGKILVDAEGDVTILF